LLPKYRGASPVQAAILNLEPETGITLIQMDEKMDHGPMIAKAMTEIEEHDDYPKLYKKLSELAASLVVQSLPEWFEGKKQTVEQEHDKATFTKLITREDAKIDWSKSAKMINAQIRALNPEPGTWTTIDGKIVKILSSEIVNDHKIELPGKIYSSLGELTVKTLDNSLILKLVQPEGKTAMSGKDFLNGLKSGSRLFM